MKSSLLKSHKLSVFDLDHTLLSVNSAHSFGRFLYKKKTFSTWTMLLCVVDYLRHKFGRLPLQVLHQRCFNRLFFGRSEVKMVALVEEFLDAHFEELVSAPVVEALRAAQEEGQLTAIASSSPDFLVHALARRFGVDFCEGTGYITDASGRFCQLGVLMDGLAKTLWVQRLAKKQDRYREGLSVYTDSILDLPLLQFAGRAVLVNPDAKLARVGRQHAWEFLLT